MYGGAHRLIPYLCRTNAVKDVPHLDLHPSLSGLLRRDAIPLCARDGTSVMCQRLDAIVLGCLPLLASPHSEMSPVTATSAMPMHCWLVDGGLLQLASGKRVVSLTKTCTAPSFLLFYYYQRRFRFPFIWERLNWEAVCFPMSKFRLPATENIIILLKEKKGLISA